MCGGTNRAGLRLPPHTGLSPRVRGNLATPRPVRPAPGSIPACAGEPCRLPTFTATNRVYPRVCGGTYGISLIIARAGGLSPRVRGNPLSERTDNIWQRSIPACAGEPTTRIKSSIYSKVYPRVCGGTGCWTILRWHIAGLSPRVRGNQPPFSPLPAKARSIPACAGEPVLDETFAVAV